MKLNYKRGLCFRRNEPRLDNNKPKYGYSSEIFHLYYFQKKHHQSWTSDNNKNFRATIWQPEPYYIISS